MSPGTVHVRPSELGEFYPKHASPHNKLQFQKINNTIYRSEDKEIEKCKTDSKINVQI